MENDNNGKVLSISDLWHTLTWHLIPIILVSVFCVVAVYLYATFLRAPKYKSTATLYILKQEHELDYSSANSDFSLALNIVNDCTYMLKSRTVLDEVIDEQKLNLSFTELFQMISTSNMENSRILEVSVESDSPELSKRIVDSVCRIAKDKISKAMGMEQVNIFSYGTINKNPSNRIGMKKYALIGIAAAVLTYLVYLITFLLDDKIKNEDDVHKYLNLSVLGDIPNATKQSRGGKYGKYRYRSRYGRYGRYGKYGKYGKYGTYYASPTNPKESAPNGEKKS